MSSLPAWIIYGRIWFCLSYILPPDLVSACGRDGDRYVKRGYCDWWPYKNSRHWERSSFQSYWDEGWRDALGPTQMSAALAWAVLGHSLSPNGLRALSPIKRPEKLKSQSYVISVYVFSFKLWCEMCVSYVHFSQCYVGNGFGTG